ncbi:sigma 54-interacting transcriptional regulator [Oceanimonas sp. NS1]|nr:sigma 54-interacting transcriptional regulator [Oceanimonas sp. NS1]
MTSWGGERCRGLCALRRSAAAYALVSKYRRLHQDLQAAKRALARHGRRTRYQLGDFAGATPAALEVKRRARLAAGRDMPVLLLERTGTGKEVLAQSIHALSSRAEGPFVGVNLAAIPESLLEAEFFGVAPGAYTGADKRSRDGKFQLANGGTLFLDEVGDMPLALQAKLLRALQEQEVEPLGSNRVVPVNVRVVAATSRDLGAMVADGSFRSDLYYRLNVLEIAIPPLRRRLGDLGILCEVLLEDMGAGQSRVEITDAGIAALGQYHWPGNIRELRNVLERAWTMSEEAELLDAEQIARVLPDGAGPAMGTVPAPVLPSAAFGVRPWPRCWPAPRPRPCMPPCSRPRATAPRPPACWACPARCSTKSLPAIPENRTPVRLFGRCSRRRCVLHSGHYMKGCYVTY